MAAAPEIDPGSRRRLTARFGPDVAGWFDAVPGMLCGLAARWSLEIGAPIPRGSVSLVYRCRRAGDDVVLKISPDQARITFEAHALRGWSTPHAPAVLDLDEQNGAMLIEAIVPGTPLAESLAYPSAADQADLLRSLHRSPPAGTTYQPVGDHVGYLFDSSRRLYDWNPGLVDVLPPDLYEAGRRLAGRLSRSSGADVLLHGDLTPNNILDGGARRGLVAIDPAPCIGDAAFDAVDLVLWQVDDIATVDERVGRLAAAAELPVDRLADWCTAFAGMNSLELADLRGDPARVTTLAQLARRAAPNPS